MGMNEPIHNLFYGGKQFAGREKVRVANKGI
jgi:hypothetical protein